MRQQKYIDQAIALFEAFKHRKWERKKSDIGWKSVGHELALVLEGILKTADKRDTRRR